MSDLLIRNIPPRMKRQLQNRARAYGRSLSDEAKFLLKKALGTPDPDLARPISKPDFTDPNFSLADWMRNLVPPEYRGDDLVFEFPDEPPKPPDFE